MARTQGTGVRTQRLTSLAATVLLAVTTGMAIGRVFTGRVPTAQVVAAGVLSAAIAVALERRSLLLATAVSAGAMVAFVGLIVFPSTTWYGLPAAETFRAIVDATGLVGEQARVQVAPTEPLAPLLLAALTATWAAIFSAHALAFRAGSPILALLPPIALVAFADTVLEEVVRPVFGLAFLVAAGALIFADGLRRVHGWGPVWAGAGGTGRLGATAGRGARRVLAATLAFAAISPLLVPGFGSRGLIDLSTSSTDQVRLDPLVSVGAALERDEPLPVFDVETDAASYWRMVTLPDFDGTTWKPARDPATQIVVEALPATATPAPSVPTERVEGRFVATGDLELPWVPIPGAAVSTDLLADGLRWDPEAGSLAVDGGLASGTAWSVVSERVLPTADDLRLQPGNGAETLGRYLDLPGDLPPEIGRIARNWTADAGQGAYERAMAIQARFTSDAGPFTYDDSVEARTDDMAMVDFLTRSRRGFCQQFAAAMAIMLRTLGIPARVAVGFTAGEADAEGVLHVTTDDAHAWVEVFFADYGWLIFDPTPGRADMIAYPYLDPARALAPCAGPQCRTRAGPPVTGGPDDPVPGGPQGPGGPQATAAADAGAAGPGTGSEEGRAATMLPWLGLGALGAGVVLLAIPPARAWRRRRRLRAAREPRTLILATYDVFAAQAADLGFAREPGQTVREHGTRIGAAGEVAGDQEARRGLETLTTLTTAAAYGAAAPGEAESVAASKGASAALKALRRKAGWVRRITGPYRRPWREG